MNALERGSTILNRIPISDAPSSFADSISEHAERTLQNGTEDAGQIVFRPPGVEIAVVEQNRLLHKLTHAFAAILPVRFSDNIFCLRRDPEREFDLSLNHGQNTSKAAQEPRFFP